MCRLSKASRAELKQRAADGDEAAAKELKALRALDVAASKRYIAKENAKRKLIETEKVRTCLEDEDVEIKLEN